MSRILSISWIVVLELIHERVFYLLLGFAGLALALSMLLGQLTYAEQSKLTLDFMLAAEQISLLLFSIFMSIGIIQREMSHGSVAMVLSKPISRTTFLLGKFFGQVTVLILVGTVMGLMILPATRSAGDNYNPVVLFQAISLILAECVVITSLVYMFAINTNGLTASVATIILFCLGHMSELISKSVRVPSSQVIWQLTRFGIPDLEIFNMKTLASYNHALAWDAYFWSLAYALVCTIVYLVIALFTFSKRDIST